MRLAGHRQLSHEVRRHIEERVCAGDLFLLVLEALADRVPFSIGVATDHVLVAVALEVDHVVVLLELVQLDIDEDPDSMGDAGKSTVLVC